MGPFVHRNFSSGVASGQHGPRSPCEPRWRQVGSTTRYGGPATVCPVSDSLLASGDSWCQLWSRRWKLLHDRHHRYDHAEIAPISMSGYAGPGLRSRGMAAAAPGHRWTSVSAIVEFLEISCGCEGDAYRRKRDLGMIILQMPTVLGAIGSDLRFGQEIPALTLQDHHVVYEPRRNPKVTRRLAVPVPFLNKRDDPAPKLYRMWLAHPDPSISGRITESRSSQLWNLESQQWRRALTGKWGWDNRDWFALV
jgi:hypothetical protein